MGDAAIAVRARDLERRFGAFVAVNRISFEVRTGEVFGFLGPNGAGKSTTIRMLCGILAPTSGFGTVAGMDLRTQADAIKARIGYMSQKFSLYEDLTVEENIEFYGGIYGIAPARRPARRDWALDTSGLRAHRRSRTGLLPSGWKQRLSLACALLHEPPVIFLDEPTSGVDPISRRRFWDLIYDLAGRGTTVFVTTHYMDEAEYCDRVALIHRGDLVALGAPATLKAESVREEVIEVLCDRPPDAMGVLERLPAVREAAIFGRGLHVVAADAAAARPAIGEALRSAGFAVERIERIVPSMEDVFVSLVEARDRAESPPREVGR